MEAFSFGILTFFSTLIGGWFALRHRNRLYLIMGFAAGVLLGVVAFDIFPEIIQQVSNGSVTSTAVMIALVCGFLLFHVLEKVIVIHHAHEDEYADHRHPHVGILSGLALAGHSFMDGVGIGLGFHVSPSVGLLVAIAVLSHDFTDGINTITLLLTNKSSVRRSVFFLVLDALTPVLGVASTYLFSVSDHFLALYLGFFAGFLLYIGASDILPEAHSKHSSTKTILLTIFGVILTFVVTRFV